MARFPRLKVLNAMSEIGMVPVFYHADVEIAKNVVAACSKGGAKTVEFVNRGDHAYKVFGELDRHFTKADPSLILGAGSIVDPYTAALYINEGANFIVGPTLNAEVAKVCNRRKIAYSPGCGSASEISAAEEWGVEICKVFPGESVGGPAFVKAILAPMPWVSMMPTGGVESTRESLTEWFKAGVTCVGMGSSLVTKEMIAKKDWAGIETKVRETVALIKEIRQK